MKKITQPQSVKKTMINYAKSNSKEYILVILIFIIGLFIGVIFINDLSNDKEEKITIYIMDFINKFNNIENIDKSKLVSSSIVTNIILAITLWLAGTTIIGMPIVLGIILFRGFCLGYTISAITLSIGATKGILFCILALFLQNLFFIPALLTTGVSGIKLYKSIINDRRKENIRIEIIRHTIISILMLGVFVFSSLIENEISIRLLKFGMYYIV